MLREVPEKTYSCYCYPTHKWYISGTLCLCGVQGGLWRLTGQQIAGAAAEGEGGGSSSKAGGAGGGDGAGGEDVRGPHASLAVKLQVCTSLHHPPPCLCMSL